MGLQRAVRNSGGADDRVQSSSRQSSFIAAAPRHYIAAASPLHRPPSPRDRSSLLPSSRPARRSFAQVVAGDRVRAAMSGPSRPTVPPGATAPTPGAAVPAPAAVRPGAPPVANIAPIISAHQGSKGGLPAPLCRRSLPLHRGQTRGFVRPPAHPLLRCTTYLRNNLISSFLVSITSTRKWGSSTCRRYLCHKSPLRSRRFSSHHLNSNRLLSLVKGRKGGRRRRWPLRVRRRGSGQLPLLLGSPSRRLWDNHL
jgi:hypothetical protein